MTYNPQTSRKKRQEEGKEQEREDGIQSPRDRDPEDRYLERDLRQTVEAVP